MVGSFLILVIIGFCSGVIVFPAGLGIYILIKNTRERRKIKGLMRQGKILVPIDPRDYNVEAWKNKKYGNIDLEANEEQLKNFDKRIFKRMPEKKNNLTQDFLVKAQAYLVQVRNMGYDDEYIRASFKKKNYSEDIIQEIFQYGT